MTYPPKFAESLGFQTCGDPELEKMVQGCWEWKQAVATRQPPRWLSFLGDCGTGKTHCAKALWRWALSGVRCQVSGRMLFDWSRTVYQPQFIYWPDFVQRLRAGEAFAWRNDLKTWPVLCLDDIGAERDNTGFASEELNTLLGCRMNRWTLLTSNLTMAGLQGIDRRIASRLVRDRNICIGIKTRDFSSR